MTGAKDAAETYFWLSPEGEACADPAEGFWDDPRALARKTRRFPWLASAYDFAEDFSQWEMHPRGDEVFIAQSGDFVLTLEQDGERTEHELRGGQSLVIPRGAWHFLKVREPGRILVLTAGRGTRHRPV